MIRNCEKKIWKHKLTKPARKERIWLVTEAPEDLMHNLASLEVIRNKTAHQAPVAGLKLVSRIVDYVTSERFQFINLTSRINEIVGKSGLRDGLVHVQSLHTTTSVFVNEWQEALLHDMRTFLEGAVSRECSWRHNDPLYSDCERHNADSHLRGMLMGQSLCLQVRHSAVLLGTWQSIILAEFDGPRTRSISVQVSGV